MESSVRVADAYALAVAIAAFTRSAVLQPSVNNCGVYIYYGAGWSAITLILHTSTDDSRDDTQAAKMVLRASCFGSALSVVVPT